MRLGRSLLLAAALAGCATSEPSASSSTTAVSVAPVVSVAVPRGFERVSATVGSGSGAESQICLWVADTPDQRAQGLMGVTDLGDADGMAFVYPVPHTGSFWMKDTLLPLSIAFFDADGTYLDAFDMEPCTTERCPTYPTPPGFVIAVETEQGELDELGLGLGATLRLDGRSCE